MAVSVCPAILASDTEDYRKQIERVTASAVRLHIDLSDGYFTPQKTVRIDEVWWPGGMRADLHVMYQKPFEHTKLLLDLRPQMIIVHAEAEGDFIGFAKEAHMHGVEVGVALQASTKPQTIQPALQYIDHVLIFSGKLGSFGGSADLALLSKVKYLRQMKPQLEIGWDGGVNDHNARTLAQGSIDVLNSGGFIQKAPDPAAAYHALIKAAQL
jgi:ribulose-phosphate 3-epimerase